MHVNRHQCSFPVTSDNLFMLPNVEHERDVSAMK